MSSQPTSLTCNLAPKKEAKPIKAQAGPPMSSDWTNVLLHFPKDILHRLHEKLIGNQGSSKNKQDLVHAVCTHKLGIEILRKQIVPLKQLRDILVQKAGLSEHEANYLDKEGIIEKLRSGELRVPAPAPKPAMGSAADVAPSKAEPKQASSTSASATCPARIPKRKRLLKRVLSELTNNDLQELHLELVGNKGSGKTKDALVAALLVEGAADFTILRKKCIPVERTRTAIWELWELDGTPASTAAREALERMKRSEIVEWLMSGGNQTDGVRDASCAVCAACLTPLRSLPGSSLEHLARMGV
jgi:hypothetical protein